MDSFWSVAANALPFLLKGAVVTGEVTGLTLLFSTAAGLIVALFKLSRWKLLVWSASVYIWAFRGIPALVVLIFIYYSFPTFGLRFSSFTSAVIGLTITSTAYIAEIFRAGIMAVPRAHIQAANVIGLNFTLTMRKIVLPQAWRITIPPYVNQAIVILQTTSLVSVVAVQDITLNAETIYAANFQPVPVLGTAAILYLIFSSILNLFQRWSERRFDYYKV